MVLSNTIQIRSMTEADILACAAMMAEAPLWQRYNVTVESASARFRAGFAETDSALFVVVTLLPAETVVGFIWLVARGAFHRSGYIPLIAVAPHQRGNGIGQLLLRHTENYFRPTCKDLFLLCSDFNLDAQRFYEREGFLQVGSLPDYVLPGVSEIVYRKVL